ncbi:hypothetical protein EJB05_08624, partial [Eragrostis curvula]
MQSSTLVNVQHRSRRYTPSPWGNFFLTHEACTQPELLSMQKKAQAVKEEVREMVLDAAASDDLVRKLDLIDALQRLGVGYHYGKEIDDVLRAVYHDKHGGSDDLYVTSLRFYLLRKHGYDVSSDVFLKFRGEQGNISSDDVNCLMTLYDAAHMRTHGEQILDSIINFNKSKLQSSIKTIFEPELAEEVRTTLETPRFRRVERVEARRYISVYEKKPTRNETILRFAKLDYNILQALYCEELKELTMWDEETTEQLPEYLKAICINILHTVNKIEEDLKHQKNKLNEFFKKMVIETAKFYHAEVKWRDEHYVPATIDEHLQVSVCSAVCMQIIIMIFISLGDVAPNEAIEWGLTFPQIIRGVSIVGRIGNDIVSHEQGSNHVASTVQTCMKQYGVTIEEANEKLRTVIEEAWMDIVEECLNRKHPMLLLGKAVNLARTMDFMYKREDAYTLSLSLKNVITSIWDQAKKMWIGRAPRSGRQRPAAPAQHSPAKLEATQHSRRQYAPSPWGDFFLTYEPCTHTELLTMKEKAQVLKEEVRRILLDAAASYDLAQKLDLIDALERLGVGYHYRKEIDEVLRAVYDDKNGGSDDLYVTSLRFYLLRRHGYAVPSVFDGNKLREKSSEVQLTLETPRCRRVQRVEARRFISVYEKKQLARHDTTILEFAKLDYNIVQVLYRKELKEHTVWWKDFTSRVDMGFARDRLVEMYFWMMAIVHEPYSSRINLTKLVLSLALIDDVYDNCTTTEQCQIFTEAIQRWDEMVPEQLPANMRAFYENIIGNTNEIVEELKLKNNNNAEMDAATCYHAEVKWRDGRYVPTDIEEHLKISVKSITAMHTATLAFVSLGDVTTREVVEWAFSYPKIIRAVSILARISNDIMSHEREQASKHMASTVQTCMKQYGVTAQEANEKLRGKIESAWMDIIKEFLDHQEHSIVLLEKVVAFAQSIDFIYKHEEAYTLSSNHEDTLTSLYVKSV